MKSIPFSTTRVSDHVNMIFSLVISSRNLQLKKIDESVWSCGDMVCDDLASTRIPSY